jgi:hypothetical protein
MACCCLRAAAAPRLLHRAAASRRLPWPLAVFRKVKSTDLFPLSLIEDSMH